MSRTQVQLSYNRFEEVLEDINGDACPGHPSTSITDVNIEAVEKVIFGNCGLTIREVGDDADTLFDSWQAIYTDVLGMKRAAAKLFKN